MARKFGEALPELALKGWVEHDRARVLALGDARGERSFERKNSVALKIWKIEPKAV